MEILEDGAAGGGRSIRDLPPSKRFKFVGSHLESNPCVPLPAKKRALPPLPGTAAVSVCLPAKKRAYALVPAEEDTVKVCLPAKKRAYVPPPDATLPACLPAKKCVHPPLRRGDATVSLSVQAKKRVPPLPPLLEDAPSWPSIPAKKRSQAPSLSGNAAALFPVCLPPNKRVMPPFIPRSPSSHVARVAAAEEARPQGSNRRVGITNPSAANGVRDGTRTEASQMPSKPKEVKEQEPMKFPRSSTAKESKDLQCKQPCSVLNSKQSEVQPEVLNKFDKAIDPKETAPAREEESLNEDVEVARVLTEAVEEEEDGVLCAVCRSTDGDPSDPIVFCDGCDLMVHASCYGNPLAQSIPDGDWFCSLCSDMATPTTTVKKGRPSRPKCCLCPARGGAMKRTTDEAWAHIACALLVPEVFFRDPDGRDVIDCSRVPGHRFTQECYICESSRGCALKCSQPKCGLGFHVSCGLGGGLCIEYREGKGGAVVAGFCREHTKLWEKQQLTGKYKIVPRGHE